jgi:peptide/nickel transport system permease protein
MTVNLPAAADPAGAAPSALERPALGPWARAAWKLWSDKAAMAALSLFLLIVLVCLLAPQYASQIAHTDPFTSNIDGEITVNGEQVALLQPSEEGLGLGSTPIGPTWDITNYFLGADTQGRDVMARILYGGRNSLFIAGTSTMICLFFAAIMGLTAGFFGGLVDTVISRVLDVIWAFPIFLLAISLSIVLIAHGIEIGPITITAGSLWLPISIIGIVYIPYVARPVRGQVLALKESEFVLAATGLGVPSYRILIRDILPNVMTTLIVFVPLMLALNMLTESALSFLSIGVQAPDASWGTIIQDGQDVLYTRSWVAVGPGIAIVLCVLSLNVLGDGVRDALDPRAKLRIR